MLTFFFSPDKSLACCRLTISWPCVVCWSHRVSILLIAHLEWCFITTVFVPILPKMPATAQYLGHPHLIPPVRSCHETVLTPYPLGITTFAEMIVSFFPCPQVSPRMRWVPLSINERLFLSLYGVDTLLHYFLIHLLCASIIGWYSLHLHRHKCATVAWEWV